MRHSQRDGSCGIGPINRSRTGNMSGDWSIAPYKSVKQLTHLEFAGSPVAKKQGFVIGQVLSLPNCINTLGVVGYSLPIVPCLKHFSSLILYSSQLGGTSGG
eukprot:sb/3478308/